MQQPITIGIDPAKSVFQVHGVSESGEVVIRRNLRRCQVNGGGKTSRRAAQESATSGIGN